eukprot:153632_1
MSSCLTPYHKLKQPAAGDRWGLQWLDIFSDEWSFDLIVYDNQNSVFIVRNFVGIIKYDLKEQKIITTYTYPSRRGRHFSIFGKRLCIDPNNNTIYIIGGTRESNFIDHDFISFNYRTKQWNLTKLNIDHVFPNCVFIPSPINQLHLTFNNTHFRYDETQQTLIALDDNIGTTQTAETEQIFLHERGYPFANELGVNDFPAKFVFNELTMQLMMFQRTCSNILYCKITDKFQKSYDWKIHPVKVPQRITALDEVAIVMAWNQIVFMFYNQFAIGNGSYYNNVWCLDLLQNKWFQSPYKSPEQGSPPHVVKDCDNNVHFLDLLDINDHPSHFKASLHDFVPLELIKSHQKKIDILITGYIKEREKIDALISIPYSLNRLIFQFCTIFV